MKRMRQYGDDKRGLNVMTEAEVLASLSPDERHTLKERIRATYPLRMEGNVKLYKATSNPIYLWAAIGYAIAGDVPLPPEACKYLLACANRLTNQDHPADTPQKIADAVELNPGKGKTPYAQRFRLMDQLREIALVAAVRRTRPFKGFEGTIAKAAETLCVSPRTLQRLLKERAALEKAVNESGDETPAQEKKHDTK